MQKRFKAVVFDLFGTLVFIHNKMNPYGKLFKQMTTNKHKMLNYKEQVMTQSSWDLTTAYIKADSPENINANEFKHNLQREIESTMLFPETAVSLLNLRDRGYKIGIVSNLATPYKEAVKRLGLKKLADTIIYSCDVGCCKPNDGIFEQLQLKLGVDYGDMLMIGDNQECDVLGPQRLGMNALLLDRSHFHSSSPKSIHSLSGIIDLTPPLH